MILLRDKKKLNNIVVLDFFRKHKTQILMLSPLIVAVLIFTYSSIVALLTIESSEKLFKNNKEDTIVKNYNLVELDQISGRKKWNLIAKRAELDSSKTKARVKSPFVEFFDPEAEEEVLQFSIKAKEAFIDRSIEVIKLYKEVEFFAAAEGYTVHAEQLNFDNLKDDIEVGNGWHLNIKDYQVSGIDGRIAKDFGSITSTGEAKVKNHNRANPLSLSAQKIDIDLQSNLLVSEGNSRLDLEHGKSLKAKIIKIYNSGLVEAEGDVKVVTDKISCFADSLEITVNADKKPQQAIFKGNPYVIQNNRTIFADSIIYDFNTEEVLIEGNIHS